MRRAPRRLCALLCSLSAVGWVSATGVPGGWAEYSIVAPEGVPECVCLNFRNEMTSQYVGRTACAKKQAHGYAPLKQTMCAPPVREYIPFADAGCPGDMLLCKVVYESPTWPPCGCGEYSEGASESDAVPLCRYKDMGRNVCVPRNYPEEKMIGGSDYYGCAENMQRCEPAPRKLLFNFTLAPIPYFGFDEFLWRKDRCATPFGVLRYWLEVAGEHNGAFYYKATSAGYDVLPELIVGPRPVRPVTVTNIPWDEPSVCFTATAGEGLPDPDESDGCGFDGFGLPGDVCNFDEILKAVMVNVQELLDEGVLVLLRLTGCELKDDDHGGGDMTMRTTTVAPATDGGIAVWAMVEIAPDRGPPPDPTPVDFNGEDVVMIQSRAAPRSSPETPLKRLQQALLGKKRRAKRPIRSLLDEADLPTTCSEIGRGAFVLSAIPVDDPASPLPPVGDWPATQITAPDGRPITQNDFFGGCVSTLAVASGEPQEADLCGYPKVTPETPLLFTALNNVESVRPTRPIMRPNDGSYICTSDDNAYAVQFWFIKQGEYNGAPFYKASAIGFEELVDSDGCDLALPNQAHTESLKPTPAEGYMQAGTYLFYEPGCQPDQPAEWLVAFASSDYNPGDPGFDGCVQPSYGNILGRLVMGDPGPEDHVFPNGADMALEERSGDRRLTDDKGATGDKGEVGDKGEMGDGSPQQRAMPDVTMAAPPNEEKGSIKGSEEQGAKRRLSMTMEQDALILPPVGRSGWTSDGGYFRCADFTLEIGTGSPSEAVCSAYPYFQQAQEDNIMPIIVLD